VVDEPPVEAILDAAATADLIVVGTHGRRGPGRWWLGSVAERVVRAATIPVLVTRAAASPVHDLFNRLAVVQDGPDTDASALEYAGCLARIVGGSVAEGGPLTQCQASALQQASLVVVGTRKDHPSWGITDPVAQVLGACQRPVLFIPQVNHLHEGAS
jgi:nucleotide-binding universal stress UspA family protein